MIRKLGFTGTRDGMTVAQYQAVVPFIANCQDFHHGDCMGADGQAHHIAKAFGRHTEAHPGHDRSGNCTHRAWMEADAIHEPLPYLTRDRLIVVTTELLLATPKSDLVAGGTWYTIGYADDIGKPIVIIYPNGEIERRNNA